MKTILGKTGNTIWGVVRNDLQNRISYTITGSDYRKFVYSEKFGLRPVGTGNGKLPKTIEAKFFKYLEKLKGGN